MRLAIVTVLLAAATAVLPATGGAADQGKPYDVRAAFAETDTNKDGSVDLGEFHARLVEVFYNADTNKDGFLTIDEYEQLPLSNDFVDADTDHDGKLSLEEFVAFRFRQFQSADKDDNAELSVDEVEQAVRGESK